ncbi:SPASM domain-containing protein [Clostridium sp. D2Q-14]|uniref:radical SAM/SPASM domain-containing protein n=1 Tax=Anaeromonas gelatinilytica TaxID=2683194 RepID=UPI00193B5215|nr:SPASM domain-containing protein [Anaeromonas gelatinilytica]MBS4534520.1 SPASM domain-containing protein [Anaeromonas gelatinilytica]
MKLKKSRYNILIDELPRGEKLIYNSFNGSFCKMNKEAQAKYHNVQKKEEFNIDECDDSDIIMMLEQGFLIEEDIDELALLKVRRYDAKFDNNVLSLTIAPTLNCNMDCPYCIEDKKDLVINDITKNNILKFVKERIDYLKHLSITWYGGEPLLQKKTIKELSNKLIKLCGEKEVTYSADIITNGVLLDKETAMTLKNDCKVNMAQITIDGLKETHNKRRHLKNNGDSFEIIINNIDKIKDFLSINIRVNIDKNNVIEGKNLIDFFINKKGWKDKNINFYFAPVHDISEVCTSHASTCYTFQEFAEINKELLLIQYKMLPVGSFNINIPKPVSLPCGAVRKNNYLIDPRGDLFKCWNQIGMRQYSVGNVNDKVRFNNEHNSWLLSEYGDKCIKCKNLPICQGGCPYNKRLNNGDSVCQHTMVNYKEIIKEFYYEMTKGNVRIG